MLILLSDGAGLTSRRSFTSGSTGAYSLTPAAWEELRQAGADAPGP
jgi:hypothetical protein